MATLLMFSARMPWVWRSGLCWFHFASRILLGRRVVNHLDYDYLVAKLFAPLDREQPFQFVPVGASLAAAPGQ
jgi:hypothetical protein